MQRITQLFVNRPPLVFVLVALIGLAGSFALATLVQQQFPNIDFPVVSVSVAYPGASPSELRDSVVIPVEDAIAGAPKLDHLNTTIQQNQATITAVFTLDSNQTTDLTEVQNRVQTVQSALPADLPAPSVRTFDPSQLTVVTLSVTSRSLSMPALSALVTNSIVPTLEQVPGVSNVNAGGTVTPALEVTIDPNKLQAHGFVPTDVVQRDPSEQRPRPRRHRVPARPRDDGRRPRRHADRALDRRSAAEHEHRRAARRDLTLRDGDAALHRAFGRHEPGPQLEHRRDHRGDVRRRYLGGIGRRRASERSGRSEFGGRRHLVVHHGGGRHRAACSRVRRRQSDHDARAGTARPC